MLQVTIFGWDVAVYPKVGNYAKGRGNMIRLLLFMLILELGLSQ